MSLRVVVVIAIFVLAWCFYAIEKALLRIAASLEAIAEQLEPPNPDDLDDVSSERSPVTASDSRQL